MKRFTTAYLFAVVAVTLLANLIFILLYGRQFFYDASVVCRFYCPQPTSEANILLPLLGINVVVLAIFALGYLATKLIIKTSR